MRRKSILRLLLLFLTAAAMMISPLSVKVLAEGEENISTIAEALAGESGTEFTVKGAVTLVDGRNIYVQDETGGICLYLSAADSTVSLGDTLIGTGTKTVYKNLPELTGATLEKSSGMTLSAKETTIAEIDADDICTYVSLSNLTVTAFDDNNGAYTTPNITVKDADGSTIQIYKAVTTKTDGVWDIGVGDTLDVKAAVGVYNTTYQLRNTSADEITVTDQAVRQPTADVAAGEVEKGTVVTFASATAGAVIYLSTDEGTTWTEGSTYTVNEAVTLYAKAVLGEKESTAVSYAYTVKDETEEEILLGKLTEAPKDGDQLVIYHPASKMVLTAEVSGSKLAGTSAELEKEKLTKTDAMAYMTVHVSDEQYVFELDGTYLTSGETGSSLTFADDDTSDLAKWTLTQQSDGTWQLMNVGAAYNETHNQALEYYNGFTTYGVKDTDAYKFDFYNEEAADNVTAPIADIASGELEKGTVITFTCSTDDAVIYLSTDEGTTWTEGSTYTVNEAVTLYAKAVLDEKESVVVTYTYTVKEETEEETVLIRMDEAPADGDQLVIYHPASEMVMTNTASGTKLAGVEGEIVDGEMTLTSDMAYMTVHVSDEQYVFELDGKYLTSAATGNGLSFADDDTSDLAKWTLSQQSDGTWYVINVGAVYNSNQQALEYYKGFTTYGVKEDNSAYKFEFYEASDETPHVKIAEALAGEAGTSFTVKGVVTLVDGKNIYIQDSTGGIDLYLSTADSTVGLGDTLIGTGTRATYNGLPELTGATLEKSSGMTLSAKTTTIAEIGADDICTYVSLSNLTVTEVYDNNGSYSTPNITVKDESGNTIQIYKAVIGKTDDVWDAAVGDTLNVKAAVGVYKTTTYQLRNTAADEIEIIKNEEDKGDLVTSLDQLTDGTTVVIYSPSHHTAISSKPNGDWYLKAVDTTVEDNKVSLFTEYMVWTVKVNDDGTYSFYAYNDETHSITVWPSGNYAELSVNVGTYPDNTWTLTAAKTADCFYMNSPTVSGTSGPAYVEAYVRNGTEVFSGYFVSPDSSKFTESEFALQFYLVNGEDAVAAYDDGEWDGVLNKGEQYVIHNVAADSTIGLLDEANLSMKAIPSTVEDGMTAGGNGTYVFTVDTMGRYYSFMTNGKYLATNDAEELLLLDPNEDGSVPETAKWFLTKKEGTEDGNAISGYILYNKEAQYGGTPVCIEYYSSVFSGWTYSTKNALSIYLFNFCKLTEDAVVYNDIVQAPSILFDCDDYRYVKQSFPVTFSLDDLADSIEEIKITYTAGSKVGEVTDWRGLNKTYMFQIPAENIDGDEEIDHFTIKITVTNSYGITYSAEKEIEVIDMPFLMNITPAPNSQTGDDLSPVISALVCNAGEDPEVVMEVNGEVVETVFEDDLLSYTPTENLPAGRTEVKITVTRTDGKTITEIWHFTNGYSDYQLYFGQLHSHTTYSDGSGTLDAALEYVAALPESANVDFVAFTDHSNYFDTTSAANPADAMNDASLMTEASAALWAEYKNKVAAFNEKQSDVIAIAGYEMTWSGGPGHINSYNTQGIVSRNNADLNNKTNDAGMKLYYETMNKDNGETLHQFNHPGSTFGNFTDFSYWDEETDNHMFLVEVGNGEGQIGAGGYYPSYEEYTLALDKGWHVAPTNNQDNHKGRWGNANDARDVILTNDFSEQGIYDAIRALRVYATEDKNLEISYTLNGEVMGSILDDLDPNEKINIEVTLYDPDDSDSVSKVEVIVNSGAVAYTWDDAEELASGQLTAELDPSYTYYYIRVTQADGDLAVTAPVWTGTATQIGIQNVTYVPETVLVNQEVTLTTTLFNEEAADATVKSMVYTVDGAKVVGTDTEEKTLSANGTLEVPFTFTPDTAKRITLTVTAVIAYGDADLTVTKDVTIAVREEEGPLPVTSIKDVQAVTEAGYEFAIEGIVTSNASGYDKDTAFFDCIYVQDETAGISCFPVSGEYKIGDKVHIEGYTDFYQGEAELQVESIEVIGEGTVEAQEVTAQQINDQSVRGSLVTLKGTVESYEVVNGLIQTIMVKDEAGNLARVFIDGYITTGYEVENCEEGVSISATGLASYDNTWPDTDYFARIRIRDRKDIVCGSVFSVEPKTAEMPTESTLQLTASEDAVWTSSDESIAKVDANGKVTAIRYGKVTITATSKANPEYSDTCQIQTRFYDVNDSSAYYYTPVYWAAENKVTMGYDRVYFGPQRTCTRRELAIFLWRIAGKPEASGSLPFKDTGSYAKTTDTYKAILWCYQNGIVKGYDDNTFRPDNSIIRKDTMIMLYRLAGKPEVSGTMEFDDVKALNYPVNSDTYKSIIWGTQKGITKGYADGTFKPLADCLREHIVTFIFRFDQNIK